MHSLCEEYILGNLSGMKMQKLMPFDKMMFSQLRPYLDNNVNNIHCLEQALYSDKLKLAGRVDLIAEWDGELAVIDFKSSTKEKKEEYIPNPELKTISLKEGKDWTQTLVKDMMQADVKLFSAQ